MDKAAIVYNPVARNAPPLQRLHQLAAAMAPRGWHVDVLVSDGPGSARRLAADAAGAGASVVFACGGDGTLNEVANGLAGSRIAAAIIRGGMGNVLAKELGVPRSPEAALGLLLEGERRRFDLGRAGDRYFVLMAGVGLDADVVRAVPFGAKRLLGSTSYALWGLARALRFAGRRTRLRIDGSESESQLYWLLLGNTRSYGGVVDITASALVDDGLLDVYSFSGRGIAWLASTALRIALKRQQGARGVAFRRAAAVEVLTRGLAVQVDGEYVGETPMSFSVAPAALDILVPSGRADRLFRPAQPDAAAVI